MALAQVAIIGGTGVQERLEAIPGRNFMCGTPYGGIHGRFIHFDGCPCIVVSRHSKSHKTPPHLVNYRATAWALQSIGVKTCLATAAVGGLNPHWPVGTLASVVDFIDATGRNLTLFDRTVQHTDFSSPVGEVLLTSSAKLLDIRMETAATYACTNGPRYETPAEVHALKMLGADVVGMTAATEAVLLHEAGIHYECLAIVTNAAAGLGTQPLDHAEVVDVMEEKGTAVLGLLQHAALAAQRS